MNRTQRAIIKAQKEAISISKRQKNNDIQALRNIKENEHSKKHMKECIKKDLRNEKAFSSDIILYKKRFADAKTAKEKLVV